MSDQAKDTRVRTRTKALAGGAALVVAFSGIAAAQAAIPSRNGYIHACYTKKTGALRVVNVRKPCKSAEIRLEWNAKGRPGADGADGAHGADGADGLSAYELAVANGFVGNVQAWLHSLVGPAGQDGLDGQPGLDGQDGQNGETGQPGEDGADGLSILSGGGTASNASTGTVTYFPYGAFAQSGSENSVRVPAPFTGTLGHLRIQLSLPPGQAAQPDSTTDSYTFTVMVAGSATTLLCSVQGNTATSCLSDDTIAVTAGQTISLRSQEGTASQADFAPFVTWAVVAKP